MKPDEINYLSHSWQLLAGKYTGDIKLIKNLFRQIQSAYSSPGRYYHNLNHIDSLLSLSDQYATSVSDKDLIDFAIFYHDIVYSPSESDNELRSAEVAKNSLTELSVPEEKRAAVVEYIIASKVHAVGANENDTDLAWFLDFDMSILGAEWERYLQYSRDVRREYDMYPDLIYNAGRKNFLQQTLSMPFIFHTAELREKFDRRARENLKRELALFDV